MELNKKMKALVFHGPGHISIEEVCVPEISDEEILVKVKYAGVCGTDVRIYKGAKKIPSPKIIGHEFSGEIVRVGERVRQFKVGDRVTVYPMISCGQCYCCRDDRKNICVNRKTIGYEIDGGFAEYVRVPKDAIEKGNVIKLPAEIDYLEAALSEPVTAAYHGIKRSNLKGGQKLAIFGAGFIGLCHVQLARMIGPESIIVIEPKEEKRVLARELGADLLIDPALKNTKKEIFDFTDGEGVDVVIVDVGIPNVIEEALTCVKKGGTLLLFAGSPENSRISIDPNWIHYREINFTGSSAAVPEEQWEVLNMIASKKINVRRLLSEVVTLDEWKKAFEMKENYLALKTLIKFE
ncbi:alcohol dehydrogenase catalytic domain-containing protein [Thermovorax subterraneus]|nr:alcohol dehydrogenase catalytic domain-containing protein [Thermovorax subterraneus]